MTLTHADLVDLTGYKRTKEIMRWLNRYGIPFAVRRDGSPSLTQNMFEQAMTNKSTSPEPDFTQM